VQESLTDLQKIKGMLVVLAEYLQTQISDAQVRLYAEELEDIGPSGLAAAISSLKADPSVWSGRFPLPAKLRSYAYGDIERTVTEYLDMIMACDSQQQLYSLPGPALAAAKSYGFVAILERNSYSTPTIYAQLRESLKNRLTAMTLKRQRNDLPDHSQGHRKEIAEPKDLPDAAGEHLQEVAIPGRTFDESEG
jgi:hypothetical protein